MSSSAPEVSDSVNNALHNDNNMSHCILSIHMSTAIASRNDPTSLSAIKVKYRQNVHNS